MKWFRLNYTDQIVKSVVKSTFAKKKLNILVMMLATVLIRSILCSLFCLIISYNIYIDFFLHAIISICLILKSHWIYDIVETKQQEFYNLTRYTINNYTPANYRRWKRNSVLCISFCLIIYFYIIEITSSILILWTLQFLFIYFIVDVIEHSKFNKFMKHIKEQPKIKKTKELDDSVIVTNYYK